MILPCSECHITYWWLLNIDSGNGMVVSGNKPSPEPMLTQIILQRGVAKPQ